MFIITCSQSFTLGWTCWIDGWMDGWLAGRSKDLRMYIYQRGCLLNRLPRDLASTGGHHPTVIDYWWHGMHGAHKNPGILAHTCPTCLFTPLTWGRNKKYLCSFDAISSWCVWVVSDGILSKTHCLWFLWCPFRGSGQDLAVLRLACLCRAKNAHEFDELENAWHQHLGPEATVPIWIHLSDFRCNMIQLNSWIALERVFRYVSIRVGFLIGCARLDEHQQGVLTNHFLASGIQAPAIVFECKPQMLEGTLVDLGIPAASSFMTSIYIFIWCFLCVVMCVDTPSPGNNVSVCPAVSQHLLYQQICPGSSRFAWSMPGIIHMWARLGNNFK